MNKYPVLFMNITVYLLKYTASVFFYIPVVFFWLCVLFYVTGKADLSVPGYLQEFGVMAGLLTLLAVWVADLVTFAGKHRKQPFFFREYPADTAALLVITVTVFAVTYCLPSDVFSLTESALR
ncbi:hypothetical protein VP018_003988 [Morganella morganii]|nr:hypothetical protein [Morganella morganii]HDF2330319.1 hypothetical protein [Morganella morganii]